MNHRVLFLRDQDQKRKPHGVGAGTCNLWSFVFKTNQACTPQSCVITSMLRNFVLNFGFRRLPYELLLQI